MTDARINPNLDRYMADVDAALTRAATRGHHAHTSVRVGIGATQSGPVAGWHYDPADQDEFGWVELVNYRGELLHKPLTDVALYDIRPCWDRCAAPATDADPA